MMAHLGNYLPPPGSAVWRRDVRAEASEVDEAGGGEVLGRGSYTVRVRHVVIRDAEIWEEPNPYVVRIKSLLCMHARVYPV